MSISRMHDDHLDPDRHGQQADWEPCMEALVLAAAPYDTGRWDWDKIHLCVTGKDADLEPWGQQGIEFVSCDEDGVDIVIHAGITFAGDDVCLNLQEDVENCPTAFEQAHDKFIDAAESVVCGLEWPGEWTGDDWYLYHRQPAKVPWVHKEDGTPDYDATVRACVDALEAELKDWEEAMGEASKAMSVLAGWENLDGTRCDAGKPSPYAAWIHD